jgi:FAD/FMN-containing dehydrogenase
LRTVSEVSEALRDASAAGRRVSVADLDLSGIDRILEHEAGDLTCTVEAGIRLSVLQTALAVHGQRLSLDPPGDPTIGACVAGDLAGPLSHRYGRMRDLLLGVTVVLGDGLVASSGGKVVKNVAGYDLGKLVCGSRGALGVVVRASLRLHPIPEASRRSSRRQLEPRSRSAAPSSAHSSSAPSTSAGRLAVSSRAVLACRVAAEDGSQSSAVGRWAMRSGRRAYPTAPRAASPALRSRPDRADRTGSPEQHARDRPQAPRRRAPAASACRRVRPTSPPATRRTARAAASCSCGPSPAARDGEQRGRHLDRCSGMACMTACPSACATTCCSVTRRRRGTTASHPKLARLVSACFLIRGGYRQRSPWRLRRRSYPAA